MCHDRRHLQHHRRPSTLRQLSTTTNNTYPHQLITCCPWADIFPSSNGSTGVPSFSSAPYTIRVEVFATRVPTEAPNRRLSHSTRQRESPAAPPAPTTRARDKDEWPWLREGSEWIRAVAGEGLLYVRRRARAAEASAAPDIPAGRARRPLPRHGCTCGASFLELLSLPRLLLSGNSFPPRRRAPLLPINMVDTRQQLGWWSCTRLQCTARPNAVLSS